MVKVALVGYGYWGTNLARNFSSSRLTKLGAIVEANPERAALAKLRHENILVTDQLDAVLDDSSIHAVVIATPVSTHFELAKKAILAGKDVWIEKPMTASSAEAAELNLLATQHKRILMVDHTFLYTGAVQKLKELIDSGSIGDLNYYDSVRTNLGLFQHDVNVIYDLAPHEFSILLHLINREPKFVQAMGACHVGTKMENLAYIHLEYSENLVAHFHLNWLTPVKLRRTIIGGSSKMIVYDDMEPSEKVKVYEKGITVVNSGTEAIHKLKIDYRSGDMIAPKLNHTEALGVAVEEFANCVEKRQNPLSDGQLGFKVMKLLEATQRSIEAGGARVELAR